MAPLLRWSEPTHRAFADRHGYDVVVHRLQDDPHRTSAAVRRAKWAKVELLAAALDVADIVLWLDADAMVVDDTDDPATHLAPIGSRRWRSRPSRIGRIPTPVYG